MKRKNKTILITGASRGIGAATAYEVAKQGANVIINYNNSINQAKELEQQLKKEFNIQYITKNDIIRYKLYEELITSEESIEKRLELLFLASEFLIHSRTADGARHIISVMSKKEYWTIQELHEQEELKNYSVDLEVFVEFLISKGYIFVEKVETKGNRIFHRYYKIEQTTI